MWSVISTRLPGKLLAEGKARAGGLHTIPHTVHSEGMRPTGPGVREVALTQERAAGPGHWDTGDTVRTSCPAERQGCGTRTRVRHSAMKLGGPGSNHGL